MKARSKKVISLDTRGLYPGFKSHFGRGTGRYIKELTSRLKLIDHPFLNFQEISGEDLKISKLQDKILKLSPLGKVTLECQFFFPRNIKKLDSDLVHFFFHGDAPAFPQTDQITSILDLIPLKFPELYSSGVGGLRFKLARFLENKAAISSKGIIAISQSTKRDIIEIFGISGDRIIVTPLGVDKRFFILPDQREERVTLKNNSREKLGFNKNDKILFYLGGIDPRKNIIFLIKLLETIKEKFNISNVKLVLAGNYSSDKYFPELKKSIDKSPQKNNILLAGFISEEVLKDYFLAVDSFIFPSLYEGFGLPIIEAMAAGIPVFAGNNSSVPELMKDLNNNTGGWMLPDNDIQSWAIKIVEVLNEFDNNDEFKYLSQENCIKNASNFTWEKTTKLTVSAYEHFLNKIK